MYFFEKHGMDETQTFNYAELINSSFPLHFHRAYEIIIVEQGEMTVKIEGKSYYLSEDEGVFIFPNQLHELITENQSHCRLLIFSPEMVKDFYSMYKHAVPDNNTITVNADIKKENMTSVFSQKSILYKFCDELTQSTSFSQRILPSKTKIIQTILLYIEEHYYEDCTLKTVAQDIQYDYAYLSKLFYQYTGMSFTEYLNRYRITQAVYFLNSTDLPVKEIAHQCGYNTLRTFNRNFKLYQYSSPTDYRNKR